MPRDTFKYSNDDITVVWKPNTCIHSSLCWKGLLEVFNPKEKPWVKMDGSTTEKIIDQVNKCPSGALSYYMNDLSSNEAPATSVTEIITKVEVTIDGPYIIQPGCKIVHGDGRVETKEGKIALCRCGHSGNKPFCDGTHRKVAFKG